jgi:hypothetical protein
MRPSSGGDRTMTASASKPPAKIYRLRLRSLKSDHDANEIHHLRAVLKLMLRHGFRAIEIKCEQTSGEPIDV